MTQPAIIHGKSFERDRLEAVARAARIVAGRDAGDSRWQLTERGDGRLFTLDLAPQDVSVAAISGPAQYGELHEEILAQDLAAPIRKVRKQFGFLDDLTTPADITKLARPAGGAAGAQPARDNPSVAHVAYACREFALDVGVPQEVLDNADHDLGTALGLYAKSQRALTREYRVAQVLTTPGSWSAKNQVAGTTWSNSTTGKPVDDLFRALAVSTNPRPNLFVMGEAVARYWYGNQAVQQFVMAGGLDAFRLKVIAPGAKLFSGAALADVWTSVGNHAVLLRTDTPDRLVSAATARWAGDEIRGVPKGEIWTMIDGGVLFRTFWEPRGGARGFAGAVIVVNEDVVIVDNTLGAIITSVV